MLFASKFEARVIVGTVLAAAGLAALVVCLPVALVREVRRSKDEPLPEWMGTVRGRRARFGLVVGIFGGVALAFATAAMLDQ